MNYKILAVSSVASLGLLAFGWTEAFRGETEQQVVERMTSVNVQEPPATDMAYEAAPRAALAEPASSAFAPPAPELGSGDVATAAEALGDIETGGAIDPTTGPKIAYRFGYGFRLAGEQIKPLQERHADMCETRGLDVCRIIAMEQTEGENGYAKGRLQLAVASPIARAFGKDLTRSAEGASAELVSSSIDGEDLSKKIVDTEARLRARIVLRDRLMEVLRNRRGTVTELVEAERGVAQVNEEIDQARSWLSEMRGRVEFAQLYIDYSAGQAAAQSSEGGNPISEAFSDAGGTLAAIIGGLIRLLTVLLPFGLLAWLVYFAWRKLGHPGRGLAQNLGSSIDEVPV
uniref:DUF4349 domain-containing protein n=1 Tax=Parerythrobacter lutipelagi TaxID=1964208 RepID=UPI0010F48FFC|nr:DUF4349 domain-containing protein [Parerythrobacter lutipelagi]